MQSSKQVSSQTKCYLLYAINDRMTGCFPYSPPHGYIREYPQLTVNLAIKGWNFKDFNLKKSAKNSDFLSVLTIAVFINRTFSGVCKIGKSRSLFQLINKLINTDCIGWEILLFSHRFI